MSEITIVDADRIETNMVFFAFEGMPAPEVCERLADVGVLMLPESSRRVRAVTHMGVTGAMIDEAAEHISKIRV